MPEPTGPTGPTGPLRGVFAAAATPLREGGEALDEDAVGPLVDFLVEGRLDGILALGTTGEGIMLGPDERRRAAEAFLAAAAGRFRVAVHVGAQTTAETAALAAHAAEHGADALAVIGPPYFRFDERGLLAHFRAAARACAPTPFYAYEFADRSGYAVPLEVLDRLREHEPNLAGMKVSDAPWERLEPYLGRGLDVLVGAEALVLRAMEEHGAVGAISGLATAYPSLVADMVHRRDGETAARVAELRGTINRFPVPAAFKEALRRQGVPISGEVRAPLRPLTEEERTALDAELGRLGA